MPRHYKSRELSHLEVKLKAMREIGLTDYEAVKAFLLSKANGDPNNSIAIDRWGNKLIADYFNGSRVFVAKKYRAP